MLAFGLTLGGGLGLDVAARRGLRAGLLVAVATWLRGAAGAAGLREVARRALGRLRRVPAVAEAMAVLDDLAGERRLGAAVRALVRAVGAGPKRPMAVVDAVLGWVAGESDRFRPAPPAPAPRLALRPRDVLLVLLSAAPLAALVLG